jgi:hypothetical protein
MGIVSKTDVDLKQVSYACAAASILSWLQTGEKQKFNNTIGPIGKLLRLNRRGTRGKFKKVITKEFNPTDKKKLMEVVDTIIRFFKFHNSAGRVKVVVAKPGESNDSSDDGDGED